MLQLISDILDLSKIEAGTFDFVKKELDVNMLCEDIVRFMKMKAKPGVEVLFDRHLPECRIVSDRNRLNQVIANFVNNAIKFTTAGSICVGYDKVDETRLRFLCGRYGHWHRAGNAGSDIRSFYKAEYVCTWYGSGAFYQQEYYRTVGWHNRCGQ